jgi:hypothetical protein
LTQRKKNRWEILCVLYLIISLKGLNSSTSALFNNASQASNSNTFFGTSPIEMFSFEVPMEVSTRF